MIGEGHGRQCGLFSPFYSVCSILRGGVSECGLRLEAWFQCVLCSERIPGAYRRVIIVMTGGSNKTSVLVLGLKKVPLPALSYSPYGD